MNTAFINYSSLQKSADDRSRKNIQALNENL